MSWKWSYETADGSTASSLPREVFTTQADAEVWLGENHRELRAAGVSKVSLLEDGAVVYGPMDLNES